MPQQEDQRDPQQLIARTQPAIDRILDAIGRDQLPAEFSDADLRQFIDPQGVSYRLAINASRDFRNDVLYRSRQQALGKLSRACSKVVAGLTGDDQSWLALQLDRHVTGEFRRSKSAPFSAEVTDALVRLDAVLKKAASNASPVAPLNELPSSNSNSDDEPLVAIVRGFIAPLYRKTMGMPEGAKIGTSNRVLPADSDMDPFSEDAPEDGSVPQRAGGPAIRFAQAVFNEIGFLKSNGKPYVEGGIREAFQAANFGDRPPN